jgi:hypothetical protein
MPPGARRKGRVLRTNRKHGARVIGQLQVTYVIGSVPRSGKRCPAALSLPPTASFPDSALIGG